MAPSPAAICARIDRENYSSGGEIVASGPIDMTEEGVIIKSDYTDRDCWWFIRRSGDRFQLQVLERLAGFLWRPLDRAANGLSYQLSLQDQPMGCTFDIVQLTSMDGPPDLDATKVIPILLCVDPSVVQVEAQLVALSEEDWADPQAAIAQRGVSPTFTKAGDGVWVGPSPYVLIPWASSDNSGHLVAFCQGYDADGSLVCSYDPTKDRE